MTKLNDLLKKLKGKKLDKNLVFYSNDKELYNYEFLGVYENEGQIEIYISEKENKVENLLSESEKKWAGISK